MTKRVEPELMEEGILSLNDDCLLYIWRNFILDPTDDGKTKFITVKHIGSCVHRELSDPMLKNVKGGLDDALLLLSRNDVALSNAKTYYDSRWWLPALVCKKFYAMFRYIDSRHKNKPELKFGWVHYIVEGKLNLANINPEDFQTKRDTLGLFRTMSTFNKYCDGIFCPESFDVDRSIMIMVTAHNFNGFTRSYLFDFYGDVISMSLNVYFSSVGKGYKILDMRHTFWEDGMNRVQSMLHLYKIAVDKLLLEREVPGVIFDTTLTYHECTKYGMPEKAKTMFIYGDVDE